MFFYAGRGYLTLKIERIEVKFPEGKSNHEGFWAKLFINGVEINGKEIHAPGPCGKCNFNFIYESNLIKKKFNN